MKGSTSNGHDIRKSFWVRSRFTAKLLAQSSSVKKKVDLVSFSLSLISLSLFFCFLSFFDPLTMSLTINDNSEEVQVMRKLHGNLVLEENGFFKKVTQKDSKLNKQAAERYYSNWTDKKDNEMRDKSFVEYRRENAQTMTNAFYDLVTDFYEYGKAYLYHSRSVYLSILTR